MDLNEEPKFPVFSAFSVKTNAETIGIDDLPTNVAENLAEDVSFRVRELISKGCQFMKNSKRKHLRGTDINRALYWSKVPLICGDSKNPKEFQKVGEVYSLNDDVMNLKDIFSCKITPKSPDVISINTEWLLPEEKQIEVSDQSNFNPDSNGNNVKVPEVHSSYFTAIVDCTLSDDPSLIKNALKDLRTNPRVSHVLPYLIDFFTGAELVSHDLNKLTSILFAIQALLENKTLSVLLYLKPLLSTVKYCVLESLTASINPLNDHWLLRDYGAQVISKIIFLNSSATCLLLNDFKKLLKDILLDPLQPLFSHYGALVSILAIGVEHMESILLPYFEKYVTQFLQTLMSDLNLNNSHSKEDAHRVFGALLSCMGRLLAFSIQKARTGDSPEFLNLNFTTALFEVFGNAILQYMPYPDDSCEDFKHRDISSKMKGFPTYNINKFKFKTKLKISDVFDIPQTKLYKPRKNIAINFGNQLTLKKTSTNLLTTDNKIVGKLDSWHRKPFRSKRNLNGATLLSWI